MLWEHEIVGSNPTTETKFYGGVGKLVTPADCKSAAPGIVGSSPTASTKFDSSNSRGVD